MKSEQPSGVPMSPVTGWLMLATCLASAAACGTSNTVDGAAHAGSGGQENPSNQYAGAAGSSSAAAGSSSAAAGSSGAAAGSSGAAAGSGSTGNGVAGAAAFGNDVGGSGHGGSAAAGSGSGSSAGLSGSAGSGGKAATSDILVPTSGALLGQYYGDASIEATKAKLGRTLPVHLTYWAWADDWTGGATKADFAAGRIPLVNWEPAGIDFKMIVNGSLDPTIKARAAGAKALKEKFFLDFAAEMNGDEAWSGNDAKLYVDAYRHIHDLFVAAGATNVVWAWCPNVTDTDGTNAATLSYYPGDDYVDWTGVDGYNWGGGEWQTFSEVFKDIYPLLAGKKKPILIGEMASSETAGNKSAWINAMIPSLKSDFPLIKGVIWFDVNKERDWRISSSVATESAFRAMAADPYFSQ